LVGEATDRIYARLNLKRALKPDEPVVVKYNIGDFCVFEIVG